MAAILRRLCSRGAQSLFLSCGKPALLCRTVHVSVWWDLNDCRIPKRCNPSSIAGNITDALVMMKECFVIDADLQQEHGTISFPITISAYADLDRIDPKVEQGLSSTGIKLTHVPFSRDRHAVGTKILGDLVKWVKAHPPPADCVFIFGDDEFEPIFDILRGKGYEIIHAQAGDPEDSFGTKVLWQAKKLLAGRPPEWIRMENIE